MAHHGTDAPRALSWINGEWVEGNPPVMGPMTHAFWLASIVFDGARAFEGVAPDLDRHCARVIRSARAIGLEPTHTADEIEALCREGIRRFPADAALYIRPLFYGETGFVMPEPAGTRFVLTLHDAPMPPATGFTACLSSHRRPLPGTAPTQAKAACLYPNAGLALSEAQKKGFGNAVMLDPLGNVAEFATANLFIVKDGVVATPVTNGTFLNGITRQRVIGLLRGAGITVEERTVTLDDLRTADEVFSTGNYSKVVPVTRLEDRELDAGPVAATARRLYWDFAHGRL